MNYSYMRLAEVYLAYAEALNETGRKDEACKWLDKTRNRVGLPSMTDELLHRLHRGKVEQAGFAVLKGQGIPSILVETAFLDNDEDIRLLLDYPAVFGQAIASGVDQFLRAHITPEGELIYEEEEPAPMLWRYVPAHI